LLLCAIFEEGLAVLEVHLLEGLCLEAKSLCLKYVNTLKNSHKKMVAKINIPKFKFDHGQGPQIYQLVAVTCYPRKTKLV
jgi:hypothetical protein